MAISHIQLSERRSYHEQSAGDDHVLTTGGESRIGAFDAILRGLGNLPGNVGSGLSDARIGSGLQEALKIGTGNAVGQTSAMDGFLPNPAARVTDLLKEVFGSRK